MALPLYAAVPHSFGDVTPMTSLSTLLLTTLLAYVLYMCHFHPLSQYPGPLFAPLSKPYKAYHVYKLKIHEKLLELHSTYGAIVRVGPNHLHTWG
ncbi:hypothetical protein BDW66DRAFT_141809 [Aspergillus desertorum]